ncbi:hypothetical protein K438DRAFT_912269 [Mycena galopus ATCC 62051]|nr:hypothetical protein K438DRAFT_912269 [Mycena galopus ATCC 62051]
MPAAYSPSHRNGLRSATRMLPTHEPQPRLARWRARVSPVAPPGPRLGARSSIPAVSGGWRGADVCACSGLERIVSLLVWGTPISSYTSVFPPQRRERATDLSRHPGFRRPPSHSHPALEAPRRIPPASYLPPHHRPSVSTRRLTAPHFLALPRLTTYDFRVARRTSMLSRCLQCLAPGNVGVRRACGCT